MAEFKTRKFEAGRSKRNLGAGLNKFRYEKLYRIIFLLKIIDHEEKQIGKEAFSVLVRLEP